MTCANTYALNRYLDEEDARMAKEDAIEELAKEVTDEWMAGDTEQGHEMLYDAFSELDNATELLAAFTKLRAFPTVADITNNTAQLMLHAALDLTHALEEKLGEFAIEEAEKRIDDR